MTEEQQAREARAVKASVTYNESGYAKDDVIGIFADGYLKGAEEERDAASKEFAEDALTVCVVAAKEKCTAEHERDRLASKIIALEDQVMQLELELKEAIACREEAE